MPLSAQPENTARQQPDAVCDHCLQRAPRGERLRVVDRLGYLAAFYVCRPLSGHNCFRSIVGPADRFAIALAEPGS